MERLTLGQILQAVNGTLLGDYRDENATVGSVSTDSRKIEPGCLFVPLTGERFDGHAYINMALEAGAAGCFTARERDSYLPGKFYIKVASPLRALRDLAAMYRAMFDIPVVGVTGSVGKTTTKDMIAAVLGTKYHVLKTEGNMNSREGMSLTLLRMDSSYDIAVIEMGMSQAGEIDFLSRASRPNVAVITNIGDSHIENLGSRENIFKAKCEVFHNLAPDAFAVVSGDDGMLSTLPQTQSVPCVLCGTGEGCSFRAEEITSGQDGHILCRAVTPKGSFQMDIPALGKHMVYPALFAAAVGEHFGLTDEQIREGILRFEPTKMRMTVLRRGQDITILNDAYNASPQSMRAAIGVLADTKCQYKIAVLGDMFELGALAPMLHSGVGECLGRAGIDCLVAVGQLAEHIAAGARKAGVARVLHCPDKDGAKTVLEQLIRPGCTVLVKASRGMAMEEIVDYLKQITTQE